MQENRADRPSKLRPLLGWVIQIASIAAAVTAFLAFVYFVLARSLPIQGVSHVVIVIYVVIISGVPFAFLYLLALRPAINFGARLRVPDARQVLAADQRPAIVYLRSFAIDRHISRDEQALASMIGPNGPFIAIGRPNEALPRLGAARIYVDASDWRSAVTDLLTRAGLVVLVAGRTPGVQWELSECFRLVDPSSMLILVREDRADLHDFSDRFQSLSGHSLRSCFQGAGNPRAFWSPMNLIALYLSYFIKMGGDRALYDIPSLNGFITFDRQWRPIFHPIRFTLHELDVREDTVYGGHLVSGQVRLAKALERAFHAQAVTRDVGGLSSPFRIAMPSKFSPLNVSSYYMRLAEFLRFLVGAIFLIALLYSCTR